MPCRTGRAACTSLRSQRSRLSAPDVRHLILCATRNGLKPHSALDLLVETSAPLPLVALPALRETFSQSNLQLVVALLEQRHAAPEFLVAIANTGPSPLAVLGRAMNTAVD